MDGDILWFGLALILGVALADYYGRRPLARRAAFLRRRRPYRLTTRHWAVRRTNERRAGEAAKFQNLQTRFRACMHRPVQGPRH